MVDVHDIGMKIHLTDEVSSVLAGLAGQFSHLYGLLGNLTERFNILANTAHPITNLSRGFNSLEIAVAGAAAAGLGIWGLEKVSEMGAGVTDEMAKINVEFAKSIDAKKAWGDAERAALAVPGTSSEVSLEVLRRLTGLLGDYTKANELLIPTLRAGSILGPSGPEAVMGAIKQFGPRDLLGQGDALKEYLDTITKIYLATGEAVTPQDITKAYRFAGAGGMRWDKEFGERYLPQLLKDFAPGTAAGGGGMAAAMMNVGTMLNDLQKELAKDITGGKKTAPVPWMEGMKPEAFAQSPYEFAQDLAARMKGAGITGPAAVEKAIAELVKNQKAAAILTDMVLRGREAKGEESPFERTAAMVTAQPGNVAETLTQLIAQSPARQLKEVADAFHNLGVAIAVPLEQLKVAATGPIAELLHDITGAFIGMDPANQKLVAEALIALAGGLAALGAVAVVTAAAGLVGGGVVAGAIVGIGAIITTLAMIDWKGAGMALDNLYATIVGWINKVRAVVGMEPISTVSRQLALSPGLGGYPTWPSGTTTVPGYGTFPNVTGPMIDIPGYGVVPNTPGPMRPLPSVPSIPGPVTPPSLAEQLGIGGIPTPSAAPPGAGVGTQPYFFFGGGGSPASPASTPVPSFQPVAAEKNKITIATNLNIDGRLLAQQISDHIVSMLEMSTGAAADGVGLMHLPDAGFTST
jgi:hypothetical protein